MNIRKIVFLPENQALAKLARVQNANISYILALALSLSDLQAVNKDDPNLIAIV